MRAPSVLACPASLKGVLSAREAAAALEDGFADAGVECVPLPLADGGEGTVDATTRRGKAPGRVAGRCRNAGVRCVVFGGRVVEPLPDVETVSLSGDPSRAREDLVELGLRLGGLGPPG